MKILLATALLVLLSACSTATPQKPTTLDGVPRVPINKTIPVAASVAPIAPKE